MFLLYGILAAALYTDFTKCRIPNQLILTGYGAGILFGIFTKSLWHILVLDSIMVFFFLYALFLIGALGGGDIKLFMVIAVFLGLELALNIAITAVMAGALCSVIKILITFQREKRLSLSGLYIHFSFPIVIGTILTVHGGITWITF